MERASYLRGPTWQQVMTGEADISPNTKAILQGGYQEDMDAYQKSEKWSSYGSSTKPASSLQGASKGTFSDRNYRKDSFRSTQPSIPKMYSNKNANWTSRNFGKPASGSVSKEGTILNQKNYNKIPVGINTSSRENAFFKRRGYSNKVPFGKYYKSFTRSQRENATLVGKPTWLEITRGKRNISPQTQAILQGGYQEDWSPFTRRNEGMCPMQENAIFKGGKVSTGDSYQAFHRNSDEGFNQQRGPFGSAKRPYYYADFPRFSTYIPSSYENAYSTTSFRRF